MAAAAKRDDRAALSRPDGVPPRPQTLTPANVSVANWEFDADGEFLSSNC
ncbi:MAG: hypothetical protein JOY60_01140 [Burkholderiaceae bacterium]|nr:hypothetical protein [Roseateles sp.]MBV8468454.1 hypothetical protein [Burkholderiaceae bacterium]